MFIFTSPLVAIISILALGFSLSLLINPQRISIIRQVCLAASLAALIVAVVAALSFDKATLGYQYTAAFNYLPEYNASFALGVDGLSYVFLVLTLITFPVLFLSTWTLTKSPKHFLCHLMAMELLLTLTFTTINLFYFFVLFESLLIPMFILIGVWGARTRKVKAAYYFFLYTLFGSLFMMFGMIYLYQITGSLNYYTLLNAQLPAGDQDVIWLCFFLAFAVKMPLFPFHIWLPEAHVEAPTVGSMLLASLLLKLGGYGFLRFSLTFLSDAAVTFTPYVSALALAGVIYGSLSTLRQVDLKRIIAYSSVSHMNLVVLGIFSFNRVGLEGATYLMVAHGLVSTALFFCVGVLYDRAHSRLLRYFGGLVTVMPLFSAAFLLFSLANMSFPGTPNFLGEVLIFMGIFQRSTTILFLSTSGIVLAAAFSVFLYNRLAFGTLKTQYIKEFCDVDRREYAVLLVLAIPSLALGLAGNIVLEFVRYSIFDIALNYDLYLSGLAATAIYLRCPTVAKGQEIWSARVARQAAWGDDDWLVACVKILVIVGTQVVIVSTVFGGVYLVRWVKQAEWSDLASTAPNYPQHSGYSTSDFAPYWCDDKFAPHMIPKFNLLNYPQLRLYSPLPPTAKQDLAEKQDAAIPYQLDFQTSILEILERFIAVHHDLMFCILVLVLFISWMFGSLIYFNHAEQTIQPWAAFCIRAIPAIKIASPTFNIRAEVEEALKNRVDGPPVSQEKINDFVNFLENYSAHFNRTTRDLFSNHELDTQKLQARLHTMIEQFAQNPNAKLENIVEIAEMGEGFIWDAVQELIATLPKDESKFDSFVTPMLKKKIEAQHDYSWDELNSLSSSLAHALLKLEKDLLRTQLLVVFLILLLLFLIWIFSRFIWPRLPHFWKK